MYIGNGYYEAEIWTRERQSALAREYQNAQADFRFVQEKVGAVFEWLTSRIGKQLSSGKPNHQTNDDHLNQPLTA